MSDAFESVIIGGWLLLNAAGALVCCIHLRLSRRMPILLAGFVLTGLTFGGSMAFRAYEQGKFGREVLLDPETVSLFLNGLGLVSELVTVTGLYLVLADLRRRLR